METRRYLTAPEAAAALGVSLPTLYAYVSRGLIRSEAGPEGGGRARRYRAEDVTRLQARQARRRDPEGALAETLHWGTPVLRSALTLIADGRLYYRGHEAVRLAKQNSVEQVATLLWTGDLTGGLPGLFDGDAPIPSRCRAALPAVAHLSPLERIQALLPLLAAEDAAAFDLRPEAVARTGARLLRQAAALAVGEPSPAGGIVATLARGWRLTTPAAGALLNAALILSADHELNVSAFTARCVASAGSTPYAAVQAGLAALQGFRHGGNSERLEAFLTDAAGAPNARAVIARWLRRGERLPGFGHPLYPEGDPRGRALLLAISGSLPNAPGTRLALALADAGQAVLGQQPTLDLGLAAVARALALPPGSALGLFALGRTIGWIGHAIEQYGDDRLIRPRAHYVGPGPVDTKEAAAAESDRSG